MTSDLKSFYFIDQWSFIEDELEVRFVPDFFSMEIIEPVVTVNVISLQSRQDAEKGLASYADEMFLDIRTSGSTLEVWGEYDDLPLTISGQDLKLARSSYSSQDLKKAIEQLQSQLLASQADSTHLRQHVNEVERFVVDLLNRAQAKKAMSLRNTSPSDAQIDALSRVLRHIRDALPILQADA